MGERARDQSREKREEKEKRKTQKGKEKEEEEEKEAGMVEEKLGNVHLTCEDKYACENRNRMASYETKFKTERFYSVEESERMSWLI